MNRDLKLRTRLKKIQRHVTIGTTALTMTALFAACGSGSDKGSGFANATSSQGRDKVVTPPQAYYDALMADRMNMVGSGALSAPQDQVLWINFNGATVRQGYGKDESFLPCKNSIKIPASGVSASGQQAIADKVAEFYSNAGVKLSVTMEQPSGGDYSTIHVGGSYGSLGCAGGASVAGIAPFDVGNANPNDVGFVFVKSKDVQFLSETIAHESGHSFGLDHTDNKKDLMYPVESSVITGFAVGIASGSLQEQDGPAVLQANVGSGSASVSGVPVDPTTSVPVVQRPSLPPIPQSLPNLPGQFASLPGLSTLGNLNSVLGPQMSSAMNAVGPYLPMIMAMAIPGASAIPNVQTALAVLTIIQNASMAQNGGQLNVNQMMSLISGLQPTSVTSIMTLAGLSAAGTLLGGGMTPVNIPGITGALAGQSPVGIYLPQLMSLSGISNPGQLIALLPQYAQAISMTSQGANAQTLMSLVMLATAQQYQTIFPIPLTP